MSIEVGFEIPFQFFKLPEIENKNLYSMLYINNEHHASSSNPFQVLN